MTQANQPAVLAPNTRFKVNDRTGVCLNTFPDAVLVAWDEYICPATGEVFSSATELVSPSDIGRWARRGELEIFDTFDDVDESMAARRARAEAYRPGSNRSLRALFRLDYVEAVDELIAEGKVPPNPTRANVSHHWEGICARARKKQETRAKLASGKRRAGGEISLRLPAQSPRSVHDWWRDAKRDKITGLYDNYSKSGNRTERYTEEERAFFSEVIDSMLTLERPHLAAIVESVQAAVLVENERRSKLNLPGKVLMCPGRDYIKSLIAKLSPVDLVTRTRGGTVAYRDLHTLGAGLDLTRPLERVEIDEQTVDLMVVLRNAGILEALEPADMARLGFDTTKARVTVSAAIDCYTACIVGLQISANPDQNFTMRTIEMIYLDKSDIAEASQAKSKWNMYGHPEELVMDKGATYISDENYLLLAKAGITNISLPGEHPFLKGSIEGFFRTLSGKMMSHLVGRTFKNVVQKAENDVEARATIDIDTFLRFLTRWVVDVYHLTTPSRPGTRAPIERWRQALNETPPMLRTDDRHLRRVFGRFLKRRITRRGIQVGYVFYQSENLAKAFLSSQAHDVELWCWDKKIGAIEVCMPDGKFLSVPCVEPSWAHATYAEVSASFEAAAQTDPADRLIAAQAIVDIDTEALHQKRRLSGMMPLNPDDATLKRDEAHNQRFMQTRDKANPEPRSLFGNPVEVPVSEADELQKARSGSAGTEADPYGDILE